jgi:D-3-phosphoglycerate dehydrogenase
MERGLKVYRVDRKGERMPGTEEIEEIAASGAEFISVDSASEEETISRAIGADAIITTDARISRRVIESLPDLQVVVRYGVGYDTIDVNAATDNHVLVVNVPDYCFEEVSNHAMALLLACARKITILNGQSKQGLWVQAKGVLPSMGSIAGQTLGLIGCGNIGRMVAKKAHAFGLEILGCDPYVDRDVAGAAGIDLVSLIGLLQASDYVSLHTPLTPETFHIIGERELRAMKPRAYLINTSRGPVVNEEMLIKALEEKWIAGAGLDVMEEEPPAPGNPLLNMDNVIMTSHAAYYSDESVVRLRRSVGREAARVLGGRWPKNLVNKGVRPKKPLT